MKINTDNQNEFMLISDITNVLIYKNRVTGTRDCATDAGFSADHRRSGFRTSPRRQGVAEESDRKLADVWSKL